MIEMFHGTIKVSEEDAKALHRISRYLNEKKFRVEIMLDPELENEEDELVLKNFIIASFTALTKLIDEGRIQ